MRARSTAEPLGAALERIWTTGTVLAPCSLTALLGGIHYEQDLVRSLQTDSMWGHHDGNGRWAVRRGSHKGGARVKCGAFFAWRSGARAGSDFSHIAFSRTIAAAGVEVTWLMRLFRIIPRNPPAVAQLVLL